MGNTIYTGNGGGGGGGCFRRFIWIVIGIVIIVIIGFIIAAIASPSDATTDTQPQQPVKTTYKIGESGPAGGIVFYDKGNDSDGWRYLEAAPVDSLPASAIWGKVRVAKTETGIGSGKRNTELIITELNKKGESGTAAQLCKAYILNGYNDWFLPSKDELNWMYANLGINPDIRKKLKKYATVKYWSSSQVDGKKDDAWAQDFINGVQETRDKKSEFASIDYGEHYYSINVRPVRVFK